MEESDSRSKKKREAEALQKIGNKLVDLPSITLDKIPLPAPLREAIDAAKIITSHGGGKRRQAQLIGKLMLAADHQAIVESYNIVIKEGTTRNAAFHELEKWRERLMGEGKEALTEFINSYPSADVQQLRQLINKAIEEKNSAKIKGASKALFRFLKSVSVAAKDD